MAQEKQKREMVTVRVKAIATGFFRGSRVYAGQVFDIAVPKNEDGSPRCAKWFVLAGEDKPKAPKKVDPSVPSTVVIDNPKKPVEDDAADLV